MLKLLELCKIIDRKLEIYVIKCYNIEVIHNQIKMDGGITMKKIGFVVTGLTILVTGISYLICKNNNKQSKYAIVPPENINR